MKIQLEPELLWWRKLTGNTTTADKIFFDLLKRYNLSNRHYHNLNHIMDMLRSIEPFNNEISDFNTLRLAVWFHDAVYHPMRKDNETQSAALAENALEKLQFNHATIGKVEHLIMRTKNHFASSNDDFTTQLMLDADLKILGSPPAEYQTYCQNIRREYAILPTCIYNKKRKEVLQHFLKMPYIYRSNYFHSRYETTARQNIASELKTLEK